MTRSPTPARLRRRQRQRGAYAVVFGLMALGTLGFVGLALDLAQVYARKTELQNVADAAALAGARALDGTAAGVAAALARARTVAQANHYGIGNDIVWNDAALSFGSAPDLADALWLSASAASASPAGLLFARVDTGALGAAGTVQTALVRLLDATLGTVGVAARAVAGRAAIKLDTLAVCAMSPTKYGQRVNPGMAVHELVEYGFRRGVGYNLLALNPNGTGAVSFLLDPFEVPPGASSPASFATAAVTPFTCTGALPRFGAAGAVYVSSPFPGGLTDALNSRLDLYPAGAGCQSGTAPPDRNVRQFTNSYAAWWMNNAPLSQSARSTTSGGAALRTSADLATPDAGMAAGNYGPLWAYARPVAYAAAPPSAGYTAFLKGDWVTLYPINTGGATPVANTNMPISGTPYANNLPAHQLAPSHTGVAGRRVLNVALLACPVAAGTGVAATALAVGRFLMTAPATTTAVYGEFGGLVGEDGLTATVELYQ